jgi:SAM-dependent methyltransferase
MGRGHVGVGGSLRAWRDFYPNSEIFGADIDRGSLFKEDRISTFWVDQLSRQALESLFGELGDNFDLIIDDGLHNWTANLNTVMSGLRHLKPQGFLVVEDIHPDLKREWGLITRLLSERGLRCAVESFDHALMVIIEKPRG